MENEFVPYTLALDLKELGFDEECFAYYNLKEEITFKSCHNRVPIILSGKKCGIPLYQQAINFLYICSNKQIDIELKGSDTHEERIRKIEQGCKDLWNLQNNKSK